MLFHIKLPFNKNNTEKQQKAVVDQDTVSTASTIAPSKSGRSALNAFLAAFSTEKYMNDPMRTTNHPDVVGYYYDPMSCGNGKSLRPGYIVSPGYDCTNTGA